MTPEREKLIRDAWAQNRQRWDWDPTRHGPLLRAAPTYFGSDPNAPVEILDFHAERIITGAGRIGFRIMCEGIEVGRIWP